MMSSIFSRFRPSESEIVFRQGGVFSPYSYISFPKGPRTQIMRYYGPNTMI